MSKAKKPYEGKRVLVTGADGFLGSALVHALVGEGADVFAAVGIHDHGWRLADLHGLHRCEGDLRTEGVAERILSESAPELVFHTAAVISKERDHAHVEAAMQDTVALARNTLAAAARQGVKRCVHVGSIEEYGGIPAPFRESDKEEPLTPYGLGKLFSTQVALYIGRTGGMAVNVARPATFFGPGQTFGWLIPNIMRSALEGKDFDMNAGEQVRDFLYIDDLVDGILRLAKSDLAGEIVNFGSGTPTSVRAMAEMTNKAMGNPITINFGTQPYRPFDPMHVLLECTRAEQALQWRPRVPISQGIEKTVVWYRSHYSEIANL